MRRNSSCVSICLSRKAWWEVKWPRNACASGSLSGTKLAPPQLCQMFRIGFPGYQRVQHGAARDARHIETTFASLMLAVSSSL
jgi:hypothetical protein